MNKKMIEIIWLAVIIAIVQCKNPNLNLVSMFECKERSRRPVKTILSGGLVSTGEIKANSLTIELENNLYALTVTHIFNPGRFQETEVQQHNLKGYQNQDPFLPASYP